jgi:hypothetical protein
MRYELIIGFIIISCLSSCGIKCDGDSSDFVLSEEVTCWYEPIVSESEIFISNNQTSITLDINKSDYTIFCGDECPECEVIETSFEYMDDTYRLRGSVHDVIHLELNDTIITRHDAILNFNIDSDNNFIATSVELDTLLTEVLRFSMSRSSGFDQDLFSELLFSKSQGIIGFTVNGDRYSK